MSSSYCIPFFVEDIFLRFLWRKKSSRISYGDPQFGKWGDFFLFSLRCQKPSRKSLIRKTNPMLGEKTLLPRRTSSSPWRQCQPLVSFRIPTQKNTSNKFAHHDSWNLNSLLTTKNSWHSNIYPNQAPHSTLRPSLGDPPGDFGSTSWAAMSRCGLTQVLPGHWRCRLQAVLMRINLDEVRKRFGKNLYGISAYVNIYTHNIYNTHRYIHI